MRAPSTVEVPCPACGEPIALAIGFEMAEPVDADADTAPVLVRPVDLQERAQEHREVCPVMTGGGRDE
ncbi:hypothetical protein I5H01_gp102 [Mycobacterium phage MarkPhew]|uniref:Uncharacterized protein n=1 Tax=Mycobacterium phage MarkPhew TaxID=2725625 RepID=A0A6M3SWE8_9CAUD|nr:hypothetical protein I5H01_gp102 [Mycobacterium phage MarkPhew]QJD50305.1 hypothetical protein SEA_MARKPHEW_5 [Mycobacterium phage MarkPhew]